MKQLFLSILVILVLLIAIKSLFSGEQGNTIAIQPVDTNEIREVDVSSDTHTDNPLNSVDMSFADGSDQKKGAETLDVEEVLSLLTQEQQDQYRQLHVLERKFVSVSLRQNTQAVPFQLYTSKTKGYSEATFHQDMIELSQHTTLLGLENSDDYRQRFQDYASNSDVPFSVRDVECGDMVCMASIEYENEEAVSDIFKNLFNPKFSLVNSKAAVIVGENNESFQSEKTLGLIFATQASQIRALSTTVK